MTRAASQAIEATPVELAAEDLAAFEAAMPADAVDGERYPPALMDTLDSER